MKRNAAYYGQLAYDAILDLIGKEHACVWPEIEAKLAERQHPELPEGRGIDPHHLSNAKRRLLAEHRIVIERGTTRGGGDQSVFALPEHERRRLRCETKFQDAAGRKRLLQQRYSGWAHGSSHAPNLIGQAGEAIARLSLRAGAAAGIGYLHPHPDGAPINQLFGQAVPIGPLDDATHLFVPDGTGNYIQATVLIEVKNRREWIYTRKPELYQLLAKAFLLQQQHPDRLLVPVLICRRAQQVVFWMARDLGFLVFYTQVQPIAQHSEAPQEKVQEVRDELGYELDQSGEPLPFLVRRFRYTVPDVALATAHKWQATVSTLTPIAQVLDDLRNESLSNDARSKALATLKSTARGIPGIVGDWIGESEAEQEPTGGAIDLGDLF